MNTAINVINLIICLVIGCKLIFVNPSKKMINTVNGSVLALPATWYLCLLIFSETNKDAIELAPFKIFALLAFFTYLYVIVFYVVYLIKKAKLRKLRSEVYTLQPKMLINETNGLTDNESSKINDRAKAVKNINVKSNKKQNK